MSRKYRALAGFYFPAKSIGYRMETKQLIGKRIQDLRKSRKMSQEQLAEKMGISPKYLSSIERGKENPTLDTFIKLAAALETEIAELFDIAAEKSPKELRGFISKVIKGGDKEKLKLAAKMMRAVYL